jgi:hypothetical protein
MNFSDALIKLKDGQKLTIHENEFIFLFDKCKIESNHLLEKTHPIGTPINIDQCLLKSTQGGILPWIATNEELLSNDWRVHVTKKCGL